MTLKLTCTKWSKSRLNCICFSVYIWKSWLVRCITSSMAEFLDRFAHCAIDSTPRSCALAPFALSLLKTRVELTHGCYKNLPCNDHLIEPSQQLWNLVWLITWLIAKKFRQLAACSSTSQWLTWLIEAHVVLVTCTKTWHCLKDCTNFAKNPKSNKLKSFFKMAQILHKTQKYENICKKKCEPKLKLKSKPYLTNAQKLS